MSAGAGLPNHVPLSADCAAQPLHRGAQEPSPTRAMCLADGDGLDGKVEASESQTLAHAPGFRGASGTCASQVETKRETSTAAAPLLGKRDVRVEATGEGPMNASPKLVRYIDMYTQYYCRCCRVVGHGAASSKAVRRSARKCI